MVETASDQCINRINWAVNAGKTGFDEMPILIKYAEKNRIPSQDRPRFYREVLEMSNAQLDETGLSRVVSSVDTRRRFGDSSRVRRVIQQTASRTPISVNPKYSTFEIALPDGSMAYG